ncbi:ATP12 family protein [Methylocystis sp. B8]|uniref:ATP12 family chaperone protein n=1 Tax=Methylocystis sp. B8 TaxID=544938 RepID=UPI0010FE3776|nr:ATP12 family protein [Methylocystis sp. B8]TLG78473.1 ATPase [Methylocystis sp. B8]
MSKEPTGLDADFFVSPAERDPIKATREPARALPKRFYKEAVAGPAEGGYGVFLDGRPVNTPARRPLVAPAQPLAEAIAAEWARQGETIDPATMPLTKLMNTALDGIAAQMAEVEAEVAKYVASDLICYRAGEPEGLAAAQAAAWDPLIAFARDKLGAKLALAEGVMFIEQPQEALDAIARALREYVGEGAGAPLRLAALNVMTTLTGSAIIALATALHRIDARSAWDAANVDEDWQMRAWGADDEAMARRLARFREFEAAATLSRHSTPD